jgi:predicted dehydrogenase
VSAIDRQLRPRHVAVIGGGRWARVVAGVLTEVASPDVEVSIHSTHSLAAIESWLLRGNFSRPIAVSSELPQASDGLRVVVANAARSHGDAIDWAIGSASAVLCEKPLTLSASRTNEVIARAGTAGVALYAAHVFLFSDSIRSFARRVKMQRSIQGVQVDWCDAPAEWRHGSIKSFDAGLPVHADVTPHILSVLSTFMPTETIELQHVEVSRGGARLQVRILAGDCPVDISMERNGANRRRRVDVKTGDATLSLEFATEPGTVSIDGTSALVENVPGAEGPLAKMLRTFLDASHEHEVDKRLSAQLGLRANKLIDAIHVRYEQALVPWTTRQCRSRALNADLRYRLGEKLQEDGPLPPDQLERHIEALMTDNDPADRSGTLFGDLA